MKTYITWSNPLNLPTNIPPSIGFLIEDLLAILPDGQGKAFLREISYVPAYADLSRVPAQLLRWLLTDPVHGVINISRRDDVREILTHIAAEVLAPANSTPSWVRRATELLLQAQLTQQATWQAYEHRTGIEGLQPRIEWMASAAAADAFPPYHTTQVSNAATCCIVAWSAVRLENRLALPAITLQMAMRDKVLQLLQSAAIAASRGEQPTTGAPLCPQDRVQFDDPEEGPQRGTLLGIVDQPGTPTTAVVLVDHALDGVTWNVPIGRITRLERETA